jgi:hypothetical protein
MPCPDRLSQWSSVGPQWSSVVQRGVKEVSKRCQRGVKEVSKRCQRGVKEVSKRCQRHFAHLSKPHVWGLVLWSTGSALSGAAGITQISALLALVLDQQKQAVCQRLREWYLDAKYKSGKKRWELDVTTCFAPLLRWIVRLWETGTGRWCSCWMPPHWGSAGQIYPSAS